MLIPFSFEDLDLDKYDYNNEYGGLIEEAYDNNELDLNDFLINQLEIQTQLQSDKIQEAQLKIAESQKKQLLDTKIQETQSSDFEINEAQSHKQKKFQRFQG
ncbi:18977_t:CDS:2 [Dentiscutata erythropus]|uniref:18977_t:CDS:1 n=1 Tax=Dentiscutata erythropus TaxID=1348616 RepID=A0A9N9I326_9GLOM|nr:18977_t:CDS:2 [Dentiscutata erythropus]